MCNAKLFTLSCSSPPGIVLRIAIRLMCHARHTLLGTPTDTQLSVADHPSYHRGGGTTTSNRGGFEALVAPFPQFTRSLSNFHRPRPRRISSVSADEPRRRRSIPSSAKRVIILVSRDSQKMEDGCKLAKLKTSIGRMHPPTRGR